MSAPGGARTGAASHSGHVRGPGSKRESLSEEQVTGTDLRRAGQCCRPVAPSRAPWASFRFLSPSSIIPGYPFGEALGWVQGCSTSRSFPAAPRPAITWLRRY